MSERSVRAEDELAFRLWRWRSGVRGSSGDARAVWLEVLHEVEREAHRFHAHRMLAEVFGDDFEHPFTSSAPTVGAANWNGIDYDLIGALRAQAARIQGDHQPRDCAGCAMCTDSSVLIDAVEALGALAKVRDIASVEADALESAAREMPVTLPGGNSNFAANIRSWILARAKDKRDESKFGRAHYLFTDPDPQAVPAEFFEMLESLRSVETDADDAQGESGLG